MSRFTFLPSITYVRTVAQQRLLVSITAVVTVRFYRLNQYSFKEHFQLQPYLSAFEAYTNIFLITSGSQVHQSLAKMLPKRGQKSIEREHIFA
jgi:hypothetical protein